MFSRLRYWKTAQELERVLETSDLRLQLESLSNATNLVQCCRDARVQLSTLATNTLARLVSALHPHAAHQHVAKFLQECLCAKTADDCTGLKVAIDRLVSLYDLVHSSIVSKNVREAVLSHFADQAQRVSEARTGAAPVKLLSYVYLLVSVCVGICLTEPTCALWRLQSAVDGAVYSTVSDIARFPQYTVYPGARQFALEVLTGAPQRPGEATTVVDASASAASNDDDVGGDTGMSHRQFFLLDRSELLKSEVHELLVRGGFSPITGTEPSNKHQ